MLYLTACTFEEEVKEVKNLCFKELGNESAFMDLDNTTLELLQRSMKLLDTATKLTVEQAKLIDTVNDKLDILLARVKEEKA